MPRPRIPLELTGLTKRFETTAGPVVAVQDVNARVHEGEFVCILGHSGCGKSTVLSMIAGLQQATLGGVIVDGRQIDSPSTDRAVVFQTPCLLPWLTARQNVAIAADQVASRNKQARRAPPSPQKRATADDYLELLGVLECADQLPGEISLGSQQCISLARALSLEPRFLLLDEPFSLLDSLTRFELQDTLLEVWERNRKIVVMVTHDVDEALYLADRLILMTDGPAATVGDVVKVPFGRPRQRTAVLEHHEYYACHRHVIDFLENHAKQSAAGRR
jgi:nitrate ABC transporter ATP-binding subunit